MLTSKTLKLILFSFFLSGILTLQEKFDVEKTDADSWLEESKKTFQPSEWDGFTEPESLEEFLNLIDSREDAYVLFYNRDDNSTYSTSPFFKTSTEILFQSKPKMGALTVDMMKTPEIANYYGIPSSHTIVFYFYKKAPIVFKLDQMEKTKKPIDQWMKDVQNKVKNTRIVKEENDLDVFENSNNLVFLIIDEDQKSVGEMLAAVGFNYPDLQFAYMIRTEETRQLEQDINEQYGFTDANEGSKIVNFFN
jgi:hypothetical protein